MKVTGVIWLRTVVDKLLRKHNVTTDEVEEVFNRRPRYRFIEVGDVEGDDHARQPGLTQRRELRQQRLDRGAMTVTDDGGGDVHAGERSMETPGLGRRAAN